MSCALLLGALIAHAAFSPSLATMEAFPLALRWLHVAAVGLWLGAAFVVAWMPAETSGDGAPESAAAVAVEKARRVQRGSAGLAWLAGAALLFSNYYTAFAPPYFFAPLDARAGTAPEASTWFAVLAGLLAAAALQERCARRGGLVPALGIAGVLGVLLTVWWTSLGLSTRAVWVHFGAFLGTCMTLSALLAPTPDARRRLRATLQLSLAAPAVLAMLAVHLPELLGAGQPAPWAAGVFAIGAGTAATTLAILRR